MNGETSSELNSLKNLWSDNVLTQNNVTIIQDKSQKNLISVESF